MVKKTYGYNGYMDFQRLWNILERKGHSKRWLRENGIHANTVQKLVNNGNVTCEVLVNLCHLLDCQPWEIMEYKKVQNN